MSIALEDAGDRATADREVDHVLDVAHVDTVAGDLEAVDGELYLGLIALLFDRCVDGPTHAAQDAQGSCGELAKLAEVGTTDDDGEVRRRPGGDLGRRVDDRLREVQNHLRDRVLEPSPQLVHELSLRLP